MEDKRLVVFCPAYYKTGGTELLHQLVYKSNKLCSIKSLICYVNADWKIEVSPTPPSFEKYIEIKDRVIEINQIKESDILIFPETLSEWALHFKSNKKCIWWLSVDNFYTSIGHNKKHFAIEQIKKLLNRHSYRVIHNVLHSNLFNYHLVQSMYAQEHLIKNNVTNKILFLSDYLGLNYNNIQLKTKERKNNILYNTLKGADATMRLIENSNFNWVKLEKLTNDELIKKYQESKIYIDFGNHPGKDRIPREAAIFGCVILTNRTGSAKNEIDIPIDGYYKIEECVSFSVIKKIGEILENYDTHYSRQRNYRDEIANEEVDFQNQIKVLIKELF